MAFDPDAYLKKKAGAAPAGGFDPDAYLSKKKAAPGMGDLKLAESQAGPVPAYQDPKRANDPRGAGGFTDPFMPQGLKVDHLAPIRDAAKLAGNIGTSLTTGPINAAVQGFQDKGPGPAGIAQALGNQFLNLADPFVPGPNWIQSSEQSLERAGVPNTPRTHTERIPWFQAQEIARDPAQRRLSPEEVERAKTLNPGQFLERERTQQGLAADIGMGADFLMPAVGVGAAGAVAKAAGKTLPKVADKVGEGLQAYGLDQMKRVVVPLMRHERKAKKPINEVIFEYGLDKADNAAKGASPETMFGRADAKLKSLSAQLKSEIQAGKDAGVRINIDQIIRDAVDEVKAGAGDTPAFYEMIGDLDDVAKDITAKARAANQFGKLDLVQAQAFKQHTGTKGAWEKYARDKGIPVTSKESVESRLSEAIYHKLNDAIDEAAPHGVKEINRQISELIPAHQALGWRQLIDNRKAKFSMTDALGVMATAIDPKMLGFYGLKKASQSGTVASKIYRLGEALRTAKTPAEKARAIETFKKMGLTDAEIKAGTELLETASGEDVYKGINFQIKDAPGEVKPPPNAVPWKPMETSSKVEGRMGAINAHNRRMQATQYLQKTLGREPEQGEIYRFLDQHDGKPIPKAPEPPKQTREFKGRRQQRDLGMQDQLLRRGDPEYPTISVLAKDGPDSFTLNGETYKRVKGYANEVKYKDSKGRPYDFRGVDEVLHMDDPAQPFKVADEAAEEVKPAAAPEKDDFLDENGQPLFQMDTPKKPAKLYHGTSAPEFSKFQGDEFYLTSNPDEAKAFANDPILGGGRGKGKARVLEIEPKPGKTRDISDLIDDEIMNGDGDIDAVIAAEKVKAKKEGVRYLTFNHPSTLEGQGDFKATISLFPNEDLVRLNQADKLQSPKGQILRRKGTSNITFYKGKADVSTLVHEHAHKLRGDLDPEAADKALKTLGGSKWDTDMEEKFARGWERYLYNGEAPNKELRQTFETMKGRLREIYKDAKGTGIEDDISPEMKLIYDAVLLKNKKITPEAGRILKALKKATAAESRILLSLLKEELSDKPEAKKDDGPSLKSMVVRPDSMLSQLTRGK